MTTTSTRVQPTIVDAKLVHGPGSASHKPDAAQPEFGSGATSLVALLSGHGLITFTVSSPIILGSSRIVASAAEYSTDWQVDRKIGAAQINVLNVAPVNGKVQLLVDVNWGSVLPVCVTLFVDP
jgi:hypothetical protein